MTKFAVPRAIAAGCLAILLAALPALAQHHNRSVSGVVVDKRGNPLRGAAVQLENSRDLAIASFITREDGRYYFHELNPDTDFTLTAKYRRWWSKPRLLNRLNSSPAPNIDLVIPVE